MKKRILSILLVACMLLAVIPMTVSAEEIKPETPYTNKEVTYSAPVAPDNTPTAYVDGTNGNDSNGEVGNSEKPYKTLDKAYEAVIAENNEYTTDRKIVISSDAVAFEKTENGSGTRYFNLDKFNGTVYICGQKKDYTTYTALSFYDYGTGCVLSLGANTVFYDIQLSNTNNTTDCNLWIAANLYDLTLGKNISFVGGSLMITGSFFDNSTYDLRDSDDECNISIYSGTYGTVYAGQRSSSTSKSLSADITLNIFDGNFTEIWGSCYSKYTQGTIKINMFGCQDIDYLVSSATAYDSNASQASTIATLNFYNGCKAKITELMADSTADKKGLAGVFTTATNVTEATATASYIGIQDTYTAGSTKYSVRFLAALDGTLADYSKIGFKVTANGNDYSKECNNVYSSVVGNGSDYTAEQLGGNYIFALAIKDIPTDLGENDTVTFTVQPYAVIGTDTILGTAYTVTYNAGAYVAPAN